MLCYIKCLSNVQNNDLFFILIELQSNFKLHLVYSISDGLKSFSQHMNNFRNETCENLLCLSLNYLQKISLNFEEQSAEYNILQRNAQISKNKDIPINE